MTDYKFCGYCGKRYTRSYKESAKQWEARKFCGLPCSSKAQPRTPAPFESLFIKGRPEDCWEWVGNRRRKYGRFGRGAAHRAAWEFHFGPIPDGMRVLHKCDNPPCVNPDHLFLGTDLDNVNDKISKGRHPRGEKSPLAKINETIVKAIRADARSQRTIAAEYGIGQATVQRIKRRLNWTSVP